MFHRRFNRFPGRLTAASLLLAGALSACGQPAQTQVANITAANGAIPTTIATSPEATVATTAAASSAATEAVTVATSVTEALSANSETHEDTGDYVWDSAAVIPIALNGSSIAADGNGVTVDGSTATITSAGTYSLSGSLSDGQIIVNTQDEDVVRLILDGVELHSSTSAPLWVAAAEKVVLILADGTENSVSDAASSSAPTEAEDEPNAAIYSMADLTIFGNGSLMVEGNANDTIASKDGLIIAGGTITARAVDDGIRGKDYLLVKGGTVAVEAGGDGLKADNVEDAGEGYISVEGGTLNVTAAGDAMDAATDVAISAGELTLASGGGSLAGTTGEVSAKGIKGTASVTIDGGTLTVDSADDAIHSNGSITINGGTFVLASGDDGMHADATLTVNGGDMEITRSYEGIESAVITVNDGTIQLVSSDDGVNVGGGNDGSGMLPGGGPGGRPGQAATQDAFSYTGDFWLHIHGGYLAVEAAGDGVDVNGAVEMTGGVVLVNGPTENMNGALDYDGGFNITGGYLVAAGSAGMAQAPGSASSQTSVLINFSSTQPAGTLVHIQNSAGEEILTFAPAKSYQSIAFSSPELANGETYTVYSGGSSTGTATNSLYEDGAYTPGSEYTSFTISSAVTTIGSTGRFR